MILTDYLCFEEKRVIKSHRLDCIFSTGGYEPIESKKKIGRDKVVRLYCYLGGVPDSFSAHAKRETDMAITDGGSSWSSVYTPDAEHHLIGYGDMAGTDDALLFLFSADYKKMEIFVVRGRKNNQKMLHTMFVDGELDEDIERLREQAKPTNAD